MTALNRRVIKSKLYHTKQFCAACFHTDSPDTLAQIRFCVREMISLEGVPATGDFTVKMLLIIPQYPINPVLDLT